MWKKRKKLILYLFFLLFLLFCGGKIQQINQTGLKKYAEVVKLKYSVDYQINFNSISFRYPSNNSGKSRQLLGLNAYIKSYKKYGNVIFLEMQPYEYDVKMRYLNPKPPNFNGNDFCSYIIK